MAMTNSIQVVGRLANDPRYKDANNLPICNLFLAVTAEIRTKDGYKEEVCFIGATVFGEKAIAAKNLKKGQEVFIAGRLKLTKWTDAKTQQPREALVIHVDTCIHQGVISDELIEENESAQAYNAPSNKAPKDPFVAKPKPAAKPIVLEEEYDDSLPF